MVLIDTSAALLERSYMTAPPRKRSFRQQIDLGCRHRAKCTAMSVSIGFVLVTMKNHGKFASLINRLNTMFDNPPIACHHDFAQCALQIDEFPKNVSFVMPPLQTRWGTFAVAEAAARAIRLLYEAPTAPDWFVLLSGADYPIKPAAQIRDDFAMSPWDAHIHHELIDPNHFAHDWQRLCYKRYFCRRIQLPLLRRLFWLRRPFSPFSGGFRCYAGEFWFSANRRAAEYVVDFYATRPALAAYYQRAPTTDEIVFPMHPGERFTSEVERQSLSVHRLEDDPLLAPEDPWDGGSPSVAVFSRSFREEVQRRRKHSG